MDKADDDTDAGIINEGISGVSKKNFVMSVDNDSEASKQGVDDKYSAPTSSIPASDADDEDEDKRDTRTKGRESFLNIYKENADGD